MLICRLSTGFLRPSLRGWRGFGGLLRFGVKFQASWYAFLAREQGLNILDRSPRRRGPLGIWTFTNRIFQLPSLAFSSLYVVGFPAMANVLARGEALGPIILRTVRRAAIAGTLIFATFAAVSPKLIPAVFGARWADAALDHPLHLPLDLAARLDLRRRDQLPPSGRPARHRRHRIGVPGRHLDRRHRGASAEHRRRRDRHRQPRRCSCRGGGAQRRHRSDRRASSPPTSHRSAVRG